MKKLLILIPLLSACGDPFHPPMNQSANYEQDRSYCEENVKQRQRAAMNRHPGPILAGLFGLAGAGVGAVVDPGSNDYDYHAPPAEMMTECLKSRGY